MSDEDDFLSEESYEFEFEDDDYDGGVDNISEEGQSTVCFSHSSIKP